MAQYQMMSYRVPLAWPTGEFGMGSVVKLPDGWTPLAVVRQGESVLAVCYQPVADAGAGGVPVVDSVTPNSLATGGTPATVDVVGSNFDTFCVIYADGVPRATFFIDATHLQYTARPDLQTGPATVQIAVQGDNGTSNALPFTFT